MSGRTAVLAVAVLLLGVGAYVLHSERVAGNTAPTNIDVTGEWNVHFSGDPPLSDLDCIATFVQDGSDLEGHGDCGLSGEDDFTGTIKQQGEGAHFTFTTDPFGPAVPIDIDGKVDADNNHASGTWEGGGFDGAFTAERKIDGTPPPTATPTAPPVATSTPVPTNTPPPGATNLPPPLTATPTSTGGVLGDANCDGLVNSIDAAFVLQFGAALLASVPCPLNADVNHDGVVNSLDAALILQIAAGLLGLAS